MTTRRQQMLSEPMKRELARLLRNDCGMNVNRAAHRLMGTYEGLVNRELATEHGSPFSGEGQEFRLFKLTEQGKITARKLAEEE